MKPPVDVWDGRVRKSGPIVAVGAHMQSLFMRVERIPREGETVLGSGFAEPNDGGKMSNAAVAAARLGAPVAFVTVIGSDGWGRRSRRFLESEGVDVTWMMEEDATTDVGVVLLPPSGVPAIASIAILSNLLTAARVRRASDLVGSASIVLGALESPAEGILEAFRIAEESRGVTILNPSPPEAMDEALVDQTDILVLNEHEAAALTGRKEPPDEMAERLSAEMGVAAVIVTAGRLGAYLCVRGSDADRFPAPSVVAVDTTGAGDAFVGALAATLWGGASLEEATTVAVRVASSSVERQGTMDAYPRRKDLALP